MCSETSGFIALGSMMAVAKKRNLEITIGWGCKLARGGLELAGVASKQGWW